MKLKLFYTMIAVIFMTGTAAARAPATQHRVVVALTSPDSEDWKLTIGNLRNLLTGSLEGATEVEVVAYGPGIAFEKLDSPESSQILELEKRGIRFVACQNSMRAQKLSQADLVQGVGMVPSGIIEVVLKQEQGWTYIKAGR